MILAAPPQQSSSLSWMKSYLSTKRIMGCSCIKCRRAESDNDKSKAVADICGLMNTKFIIQSGTHFTEVVSLKDEVSVNKVKSLRGVCRNGDHYLAQYEVRTSEHRGPSFEAPIVEKNFYVIKGKSCVQVNDLTEPLYKPAITLYDFEMVSRRRTPTWRESIFTLHRQCRGGDFYLANRAGFYIIRSKDNTYLHVHDMSEEGYNPSCASRHKLHTSFANGLCYFATEEYFYVLKEDATFGLVYHRTKDLRSSDDDVPTVSPSIVKFMQNSPLDEGTV